MKRVFALILACLLFLLSACGIGGTKETAVKTAETKAPATTAATPPEEDPYILEEMEGLDAESIDYWNAADMDYTCFVFRQDGKYGTMDKDGNVIVAPQTGCLDLVFLVLTRVENSPYNFKYGLFAGDTESLDDGYVVEPDGAFLASDRGGIGPEGFAIAYWTADGPKMIVQTSFGEPMTLEEFNAETYASLNSMARRWGFRNDAGAGAPFTVIPVQNATGAHLDENQNAQADLASEKYGLMDVATKTMLTDFIYDECSLPVDGVIAVRIGDKCGYLNEKGEILVEPTLEPARVYEGPAWSEEKGEYTETYYEMYLPVNGAIVTRLEGKYGMIDTEGTTLLLNQYDCVSQVGPDGVFFLKEDTGVWFKGTLI